MAKLKTTKTTASVTEFINSIENTTKKADSKELLKIFKEITKEKPKLWNNNVVGFGTYNYKSERSSQAGEWYVTGFSPRKQNMTIYVIPGFNEYGALLEKLGKYKTSRGCLYINKLEDIHIPTLKKLIKRSVADMKKLHTAN